MRRIFRPASLAIACAGLLFTNAASAATAVVLGSTQPRSALLPPPEVVPDKLTSDERPAHLTWSLRAALNVAALQCQFSPYFASVSNYNELLRHHSGELATSYKKMEAHFKRVAGNNSKKGQKEFDVYTTRTYNSYSTLLAQETFCEKAADVAREALTLPKGGLAKLAEARVADLRASLTPQPDALRTVQLSWVPVPAITNPCLDSKGRLKKRC